MRRLAPSAVLLAALLWTVAVAPPSLADEPDVDAQPVYGTVRLKVGFEPDPHTVVVQAGGDRSADGLGEACGGFIDFAAPDVDFAYEAGSAPLYVSVRAPIDTTLVINDPSGNWLCNDDFDGLNPGILIEAPESGLYNIWVGTIDLAPPRPAILRISEIPPRP